MRTRGLVPLTLMIVLLASAGFGQGHAASSYDDWERVLHDCDDDWGTHESGDEEDSQDRSGHDLVALDVHEGTAPDGTRAVGLRLTMDLGFAGDETGWLNDTVTFTVNRSSGEDFTVTTTTVTTDNETFTVATGEDQNQTLTPLERTDTDDGRFYVDLWYGYDQLSIDDGDNLTDFHVQGQFDGDDRDHMLGGYTPAEGVRDNTCTIAGDTYQESTPYQINQAPGLPPQPSFDVSPSDPVTGQEITFNDTSTDPDGEIVAWSWDLGDGTTVDTRNLTHAYDAPGTYTVSLTVTDDRDNQVTTDQDITVADAAPEAGFTWSPNEPEAGQTVTFTDTSTDAEAGTLAHEWTFGDGETSTAANPDHVYDAPGTYAVTLNVTDDADQTDTITQQVTVVEATEEDDTTDDTDDQSDDEDQADDESQENQDPVAEIAFSPEAPLEGETVTFQDVSTDPDGEISSRSWTFGDTVSSEKRVANHTYTQEGEFTVTLTVTDDQGATNTTSLTIEVLPAGAVGGEDEALNQTAADEAGDQTNATGNQTANGVPALPLVAVLAVLAVAAAVRRR